MELEGDDLLDVHEVTIPGQNRVARIESGDTDQQVGDGRLDPLADERETSLGDPVPDVIGFGKPAKRAEQPPVSG